MKTQKTILHIAIALLGILVCAATQAADDSVGVLYLQNNSSFTGHVFVDGQYQGYVPPGKAQYSVREGFVTRNSGVQPDGSIKQNYSHGGWSSKGSIVVTINGADAKTRYETRLTVSGDPEHKAYVWWGDKEPGPEPESLVWENSSQIVSGKQPVTPEMKNSLPLVAKTKGQRDPILGTWKFLGGDAQFFEFRADGTYVRRYSTDSVQTGKWKRSGNTITTSNPAWDPPTISFRVTSEGLESRGQMWGRVK